MTEVPCIRLDHLTDDQRRAYALAHNKTAELSEWDFSSLDAELAELDDLFKMSDFGFDELEKEMKQGSVEEDEYEAEIPVDPKTRLGDIYRLGNHRLMCGDATSEGDVKRLLDGKQADLLLTDPPYGISVVQSNQVGGDASIHFGKVGGEKIVPSSTYMAIKGDETTDTAKANFEIVNKLSKNQVIFGGNYFTDFLPPSRCWVVWDKQNSGNFADAELAWTSFDKGVKLYHFMWNGLVREGSRSVEGIHRVHPTQKPVGLMGYIINDFSKVGDLILDCFGGSGSTLIACEQTERTCFMIEYEPHYCDVIIDRWEQFTGKNAELLT